MEQARLRGTREERIAQAAKQPPKPGLYVSTREAVGMRLLVDDVFIGDDGDSDDYFLVSLIDEASASDQSAMGDELDPDQWFELVERFGLIPAA